MKMPLHIQTQDSDSDDEQYDTKGELHTLSNYVDNEDQLVEELFLILKPRKIQSMLPGAFKSFSINELKKLFRQELAGMSRARILAAINGEEVNMSSSSESELSDSDYHFSSDESFDKIKKKKLIKNLKKDNEDESKTRQNEDDEDSKLDPDLKEMDLMELEMRYKLIKTMIDKQPNDQLLSQLADPNFDISKIKIKEEPVSPPPLKIKEEKITPPSSRHSSKSRSSKSRSRSRSSQSSSGSSSDNSDSLSSSSKSSDEGDKDLKSKEKRKLTKKEFEERMKKAKMNRSYREKEDLEGYDSEEEEKIKKKKYKKWKERMQRKLNAKAARWEKQFFKSLKEEAKIQEKSSSHVELGEATKDGEVEEGELESNEEGEVDSNEEEANGNSNDENKKEPSRGEEGACTPSDGQEDGEVPEEYPEVKNSEEISLQSNSCAKTEISAFPEKISNAPINIEEIELIGEDSDDKNTENSQPSSLPSKEERQSVSFALLKKSSTVNSNGSPKDNDSEDEWNSLKECSPLENIEIIGEEDPEVENEDNIQTEATEGMEEDLEPGEEGEECLQESAGIIGTIEAKNDAKPEEAANSWSSRWLNSEKVQTVVSNSKIMSKVRKKIQAKGKFEKPSTPVSPVIETPVIEPVQSQGSVIGSIEEYTKILGIAPRTKTRLPAGLGSDSDDSDQDELWAKMMNK